MHILLIAYAFPPDPLVGSHRAEKVAQAFRSAGHQVTVFTARLPGESGLNRVEQPGYRVEALKSIPNPRHALIWLKEKLRRHSHHPRDRVDASPGPAELPAWKRHLLSLVWLPDDMQGFVGPAVTRGLPMCRSEVDLVYTTAPPFSDHLIGLILKATTGVRWALEFRDPWVDNPHRPMYTRSAEADAVNAWLERRCLRSADHVVTVTEGTLDLLQAKLPEGHRDKVTLARNGIDRFEPLDQDRQPGPFRIVHTGSLYHDRDPRPFFRALAALRQRGDSSVADVQVDFFGQCDSYDGESLPRLTHDLGIGPLVRFTDWIPHDECQRVLARADLLLLFVQNNPNQVANKLYEYLGARKPILAFGEAEGESVRMLAQVGGHFLVSHYDALEVERVLLEALRGPPPSPSPGGEYLLEEWSTERQMELLLSALGLGGVEVPTPQGHGVPTSRAGAALP
jgi:glycosyltransferase involved in cell wall biosynthesis